ncbi:hypothetical protein SAMN04487968_103120 [Nocardioides terrae]|uniref:4-amino-4-deoxy-L-arabinose transferase n=1 Tax=Nocardioides terrae TaxID=574651 RepID=A0A1I1FTI7_9ACTN|nr:hypothetical protein [Nocardioides terrae]SFC02611.1 hypothetical protein SAMN04487968_103120 [Nocardioides terrae]
MTALHARVTAAARPLRGAPRHPVILLGLVIIAAGTVLRGWAVSRTWFWLDDLILVGQGQDGLGWGALTAPYNGHLMPGGRLLAWSVAQGSHYDYSLAATQIVALYVLACLAVLRLLVTLFGRRPAILVALSYFAFSPWLIPATTWWAATINHLPVLATTALALDAHVRHLRTNRRGHLVASVVWMVVGLAFAELALFAYIPLVVITLGYFTAGSPVARLTELWSRYRPALLAHTVLVVVYAGLYLSSPAARTPPGDGVAWREYVDNIFLRAFPAAVIGGPGSWTQPAIGLSKPTPSVLVQVIALAVIAAVFALASLTRDRGLRAWSIPLLQLAAITLLVGHARQIYGPDLALDLRFTTPLALGVALGLGLAFLEVPGARECSTLRARHWILNRWPGPAVATAAFVAFAIVSASRFPLLHVDEDDSARPYLDTFAASLARAEKPVTLIPGVVAPRIVSGAVADSPLDFDAQYRRVLHPWRDELTFTQVLVDDRRADASMLDDSGAIVPASLTVARRMREPAPAAGADGCSGYPLSSTTTYAPLDGPISGSGWLLRVSFDADIETPVRIRAGERRTDAVLPAGEHTVLLAAPGDYDAIAFSGLAPGAEVCVTGLAVGRAGTSGAGG